MRMPAIFVGHGSPMHALGQGAVVRHWARLGGELPRPRAILCISAHWETDRPAVTDLDPPPTIHDFGGFPAELYELHYPAPGSPELVAELQHLVPELRRDTEWGLDHGTWAPLRHIFPAADIPVVQFSLARAFDPAGHNTLARRLAPLREAGVLIVGSGNIVHNLRRVKGSGGAPHEWAEVFDAAVAERLEADDADALIKYPALSPAARLAVPTPEHYLPLLYVLGVRHPEDRLHFFNKFIEMGSLSMRSFILHAGGEEYEL